MFAIQKEGTSLKINHQKHTATRGSCSWVPQPLQNNKHDPLSKTIHKTPYTKPIPKQNYSHNTLHRQTAQINERERIRTSQITASDHSHYQDSRRDRETEAEKEIGE